MPDKEEEKKSPDEFANSIFDKANIRLALLDDETSLKDIVEVKIHSLFHFLKSISFKGYAKWSVINQVMKEEHPKKLGLSELKAN
mgnify:CR=1 FL=1|jgi:hypothetical protein